VKGATIKIDGVEMGLQNNQDKDGFFVGMNR
jgi:hypothetical protein